MISESERAAYERLDFPLVMIDKDETGKFDMALISDGLLENVGVTREEMFSELSDGYRPRIHPDDLEWFAEASGQFMRREKNLDVIFRSRRRAADGRDEYRLVHAVGVWQRMDDGSEAALIIYNDLDNAQSGISRLYAAYGKSNNGLLYEDAITGLPNLNAVRQFADERFDMLRVLGKQPMLLYCDIKSMHTYNVQYGYASGDRLLQLTAEALKVQFPNATLARGTDDHFIVIDEFTGEASVSAKINAISAQVREQADGTSHGVHAGVCCVDPETESVLAFDRAREALNEERDDLSDICHFYSLERDEAYWLRTYIRDTFEHALESGWIKVFYQPIFRTQTRKMSILESLARWNDPVRGLISPGQFIPVLRRYHLLHKLDLYMVEQICREFPVRVEAGLSPIPVTVNVSAQDFDHVDVVEQLNQILSKYGIGHDKIIIEITEQDIAKATEHFKTQLIALRENGYKLWIDDFGSGYSSLNVFSQFGIDCIKFDMELLQHLDDMGGANRRILRAFTNVCRELGVHTLSEGVETEAQLSFLREIDCELAQGFFLRRPAPVEESVFKARHIGPATNFESAEERLRMGEEWLTHQAR